MIFIALNYNGIPISIVCAKSKELACAFWQGKGIVPHSVKDLQNDFTPLSSHPTGVFPLLETKEETYMDYKGRNGKTVIEVVR